MSALEYKANLDIYVHRAGEKVDHFNYRIESFEVDGGANRKIELGSTPEAVIDCEMSQARTYKNLVFYLKSNRRHSTSKLIELFGSGVKTFNAYFYIYGYEKTQKRPARVKNLIAKSSFLEAPIPIGGTPPALKIKLGLDLIEYYQGGYNKQGEIDLQ